MNRVLYGTPKEPSYNSEILPLILGRERYVSMQWHQCAIISFFLGSLKNMIVWEGPRPIDNVPFPPRRLYHSKNSQLVRGEAASCAGAHLVGPEATEAGEARKNKLLHPPRGTWTPPRGSLSTIRNEGRTSDVSNSARCTRPEVGQSADVRFVVVEGPMSHFLARKWFTKPQIQ